MPCKKDSAGANASSGESNWKWTAEHDRTLFLLIFGRSSLSKADYEQIATALSPNVNWNGVRQRIGRFRSEQKMLFQHLGWDAITESPAKPPRKRKGSSDESGEMAVKTKKKARVKKGVEVEEPARDEEEGEVRVKEEDVEDDV